MNFNPGRMFLIPVLMVLALLSASPVIEGDLFWHVRTGQGVFENCSPPVSDEYTFTSQKIDPLRPDAARYDLILKGNWLSQPLFYLVHLAGGIPGIVLLRVVVILLMLTLLYIWLRNEGVGPWLSLIFVMLSGYFLRYQGDRPHYFSYLFFLLLAMLLEELWRLKDRQSFRSRVLYFSLPALMLLWANMHQGYVMGVALILIYLVSAIVPRLIQTKFSFSRPLDSGVFLFFGMASVFITLLNPVGYKVYPELLRMSKEGVLTQMVIDHITPFAAALRLGEYNPSYWLLISVTLAVLVARWRRMELRRIAALIVFGASSLMVLRNIPFFILLVPMAASEAEKMLAGRLSRTLSVAACLLLAYLGAGAYMLARNGDVMDFSTEKRFPVDAVKFMDETGMSGNIFNLADWGGYIGLYSPERRVFEDGRRLMTDVGIAHQNVIKGTEQGRLKIWRQYLDAYKADILLVPSVTPGMQEFLPLIQRLYYDDDFALVYSDKVSLIYLRKATGNEALIAAYTLPKELSLIQAINRLNVFKNEADRRDKIRTAADLYEIMGKAESARIYRQQLGN